MNFPSLNYLFNITFRDVVKLSRIYFLYYWIIRPVIISSLRKLIKSQDFKVNFILAGVVKAGTTAVYESLKQTDQLCLSVVKEVKFFTDEKFYNRNDSEAFYHSFFNRKSHQKLVGEASPSYLYHYGDIQRIYNYNKDIKLIVILRNPIERAYSHWNMRSARNQDPLSFSQAIRKEKERLDKENVESNWNFSYLKAGQYVFQLQRMWQYFPKQQTLVIKHDDLLDDYQSELEKIYAFLGISGQKPARKKMVHARSYPQSMNDTDKEYLLDYYREDILALEKILGWDCSHWLD